MRTTGQALALALLAVLAAGNVYLKTRQSVALPRFKADDETCYFRAESALQYRYARLAAGPGIPTLDREAQYPEGLRTGQELTLTMERATGWAWRACDLFLPVADFRWFVLLFIAAVASLGVPALYGVALSLGGSETLALCASAAFACSWAGMANGIGTYGLESFALPWMLGSLAFLAAALESDSTWRSRGAAGLLMAAALASWHFAVFHLAALFLALAWTAWRQPSASFRVRDAATALVASGLAAGLLLPPLRETAFIISPTMVLGYGLVLALSLPDWVLPIALATTAAVAVASRSGPGASAYGHVYGLIWEKLRLGLVQPRDPSLLDPNARLLWSGPFRSPDPGFAIFAFLPLAAIMLPRFVAGLIGKKGQPTTSARLIDALLLLYLAGAVLVARLTPTLAFLLCAAACGLPREWRRSVWVPVFFLGLAAMEGAKCLAPSSPWNPFLRISAAWTSSEQRPSVSLSSELALIRWLHAHGGTEKPVLANYGLSASLLTYGGSPILLQPKFEAAGIRAKTLEFLRSLYGTEEDFAAFCRRYDAALFIYSVDDILDETPDGPRYASGDMRLRPETAAVLLHFHPERLKVFRLLFENPEFRVFGIGPPGSGVPPSSEPVYELERYAPSVDNAGWLHLDVVGVNERMSSSRRYLVLAHLLARLGRAEDALAAYETAFAAWPPDSATREQAQRLRAALEAATGAARH